jgi:hypothetical protein
MWRQKILLVHQITLCKKYNSYEYYQWYHRVPKIVNQIIEIYRQLFNWSIVGLPFGIYLIKMIRNAEPQITSYNKMEKFQLLRFCRKCYTSIYFGNNVKVEEALKKFEDCLEKSIEIYFSENLARFVSNETYVITDI